MKCQHVLRSELRESPTGYPASVAVECTQTVGVRSWWDAAGVQRAACHAHLDAVMVRSNWDYHATYVRLHEWGRPNEYQTLRMIRPEAQR